MKRQNESLHVQPIIVPTSSSLQSFNFYLVASEGELLLVDSGIDSEKCWRYLHQTLQENGFSLKDIDKIVLTHSHQDHTGLVNRILDVHDIPVYAHKDAEPRLYRDQGYIQNRIAFFQQLYREMGCKENGDNRIIELKEKAKANESQALKTKINPLEGGDSVAGFDVIETPGHWPDHIVLCHQESGILFGGDHLVEHVSSNAMIEPDARGKRLRTLVQYEASLKKCRDYALNIVYPGHGAIIDNPAALIEKRLNGIDSKSEKIRKLISVLQPCTADEVARMFYEKAYNSEFSLVMSEIIGHLDRLETLEEIEKRKIENQWVYSMHTSRGEREAQMANKSSKSRD
ncbi:MBL fold metallo-hydrolase [Lentibacillus salinarum]|uniref:MBL fold metallo-hydrolase n=1 Tax=Lentibacillus salinarum TaxID=446820 RepID=A0ABW3ZTJ2_9BACI